MKSRGEVIENKAREKSDGVEGSGKIERGKGLHDEFFFFSFSLRPLRVKHFLFFRFTHDKSSLVFCLRCAEHFDVTGFDWGDGQ